MIPVNEPVFSNREKELLNQCIESGWLSGEGPFVSRFEEMFADFIGVKHGIAVCNGTAALELCVSALKLNPADEIIIPTHTIISCALAVIRNGLKPVLVDADPETWNLEVNQVRDRIGPKTKAIMPVHTYGHPAEMDPLIEMAHEHGLHIIEDAAEVHGAEYKGCKCGSLGKLAAFSFYANKIVSTGEGGMVVTDDDSIAEQAKYYRNLCFQPRQRFLHDDPGYNMRMTNMQAAVGVAQMERVNELVDRKIWQGREYRKRLKDITGITLQAVKPWAKPVYWVNGIVLDDNDGPNAVEFAIRLQAKGIQTRPFFWPLHQQPVFHKMGLFMNERHPTSERLARQGLYLPSGMALTESQIDTVCSGVLACIEER